MIRVCILWIQFITKLQIHTHFTSPCTQQSVSLQLTHFSSLSLFFSGHSCVVILNTFNTPRSVVVEMFCVPTSLAALALRNVSFYIWCLKGYQRVHQTCDIVDFLVVAGLLQVDKKHGQRYQGISVLLRLCYKFQAFVTSRPIVVVVGYFLFPVYLLNGLRYSELLENFFSLCTYIYFHLCFDHFYVKVNSLQLYTNLLPYNLRQQYKRIDRTTVLNSNL